MPPVQLSVWAKLDPWRALREIADATGEPTLLSQWSLLDPAHAARIMSSELGITVTPHMLLDSSGSLLTAVQAYIDEQSEGGGDAPYVAEAVHFDGLSALYNSDMASGITSAVGTYFYWHRIAPGTPQLSSSMVPIGGAFPVVDGKPVVPSPTDGFQVYVSDDQWLPSTEGTTPQTIQFQNGSDDYAGYADIGSVDGQWHLTAFSWDLTGGVGERVVQILHDRVLQEVTLYYEDGNGFTIDWTLPGLAIGALGFFEGNLFEPFVGDLSDIYLNIAERVDLSNVANVNKIISMDGKPVDLGPTGSLLTGSQPWVYLRGNASNYGDNLGSAGSFATFGSLTNASTSPSD